MSATHAITPLDADAAAPLLDGLPCAVCMLDENDHILIGNAPFARLFATKPPQLTGRLLADFVIGVEWRHGIPDNTIVDCIQQGATTPFGARLTARRLPDGQRQLITLFPLPSESEDRRHLESLATLAGGVAHEFNNALSVIIGYTDLIPEITHDQRELAKTLGYMGKAARRGVDIVKHLQLFARTAESPRTPHDLDQIIRDSIAHTTRHWPGSIEIDFSQAAGSLMLSLNAPQVILALQNLLHNARQALPGDTGRITLSTTRLPEFEPPRVQITIEDNGTGMDHTMRSRALEPFHGGHLNPGRSGLGLSVVYGVIKAHGGDVEIGETPADGGAQIRLWLPLCTDPAQTAATTLSPVDAEQERTLIEAVRE